MKNPLQIKFLSLIFFLFLILQAQAQLMQPFTPRYTVNQKGNITFVSNNITSCGNANGCGNAQNEMPPNGSKRNNDFVIRYIDIDNDNSTFSSSSADLNLPNCSYITFAGLYWTASVNGNRSYNVRNAKIKLPGQNSYTNVYADDIDIYYSNSEIDTVYNCFKNITSLINQTNPNGTYTVANVFGDFGSRTNRSAGWTLVIVYQNPSETNKNLTVFDGWVALNGIYTSMDVPISGFITPPTGLVNLQFGFVDIDGDRGATGDYLRFNGGNGFQNLSNTLNPANDIFNSTITRLGANVTNRNPAHSNTLGYDADIINPPNNNNSLIGNNVSSATLRVTGSSSEGHVLTVVTTSIETYDPLFTFNHTMHDLDSLTDGDMAEPGDTLLLRYYIQNLGIDQANQSYLWDTIPINTEFVPGSIRIVSGPNTGNKTDAVGDDQGMYYSNGRVVRVNLGTGANANQGGTIGVAGSSNSTTEVQYKVVVTKDCKTIHCNGGQTINNAELHFWGVTSGGNAMKYSLTPMPHGSPCTPLPYAMKTIPPGSCPLRSDTNITAICSLNVASLPYPGYQFTTQQGTPVSVITQSGTYVAYYSVTPFCGDSILVHVNIDCPPIAVDDHFSTPEDTPLNGDVSTNDSDPDNSGPMTFSQLTQPAHGTVVFNSNGTFTYTPAPDYNGPDQFTYRVCDGDQPPLCDTATVYITVTPVNDAPVVFNEYLTTPENTPLNGTLANGDYDPDSTTLVYGPVLSGPSHGTIVVNPDGTFIYTPANGYDGPDQVIIRVCDQGIPLPALCTNDTLFITVIPVNDPPVVINEHLTTPEDTPLNGTAANGDYDPDGTALTYGPVVSGPSNGSIVIHPDGSFTYTPNPDFNGNDMVVISVCDNGIPLPAACTNDTIFITVTPVNDPPVIVDGNNIATDTLYYTTPEDTPITICIDAIDIDGDSISFSGYYGGPVNGTISNINGLCFTYTPNQDFNGLDSLYIIVCDDGIPSLCDTAIVYINVTPVNDPPVIVDGNNIATDTLYYTTPEDTPITICIDAIDIDGDSISFSGYYGGPVNGTISNINGLCFTYTPNQDFNGLDSLYIIVCDDGIPSLCDTAIVYINVTPVNDPPVIVDGNNIATDTLYYTTPEDTPITICIDAIDIDGDSISFSGYYGGPVNGTISNINGLCFTYTPNQDFNGLDSLYIIVCDDGIPSLCDTAIVYINVTPVNDPPVIVDGNNIATDDLYYTTPENTPITICINATDIDGDQVTLSSYFGGPLNGTISNVNGLCFTYTPNNSYNGLDSLYIIVCDDGIPSLCDTALVHITVTPVNDPPVIVDGNNIATDTLYYTTPEDTPITICIDAIDIDGDSISFSGYYGGPANGTISNINGLCFTYTPNQDFNGLDSLYIIVCDDGIPSLCDTAIVYINVTPVNDPPVIVDGNNIATDTLYYTTPEDTPITICIDAIDIDGDSISFSGYYGGPVNGTISNINGLCFTYTPNQDFNGLDSLYIIVCDDGIPSLCDTAIVYINVTPVNDPPVIVDGNNIATDTLYYTTPEDTPITICIDAIDIDGDSISFSGYYGGPVNGTISNINGLCFTYTPNQDFNGLDSLYIIVCDDGIPSLCDTAIVYINVTPVNDPPIIVDSNVIATDTLYYTTPEDTPITICIDAIDIDGDSISFSGYYGGPANGTISNINGLCFTYTPNQDFNGLDSLYIIVCDDGIPSLCDTAIVYINVTPVNDPPVIVDGNNIATDTLYYTTPEDTPITICIDAIDIDGDSISFSGYYGGPVNGTISNINGLCFTYTPNQDFNGLDSLYIIVCDDGIPSLCDTAIVYINVTPVNDPPVIVDGNNIATDTLYYTTPEDTPITICIDAIDIDGDSISFSGYYGGPVNGTISNINGLCFTYTPNQDFNGLDSLYIIVCDDGIPSLCDTAIVYINVTPVNDPPIIVDSNVIATDTLYYTTPEDTPITICIDAIDIDGDSISFSGYYGGPANGTISNINGLCFTYTPNQDFNGLDSLYIIVCDDGIPSLCDTAIVYINVTPVNDPPIIVDSNVIATDTLYYTTPEDTPITICIDAIDIDGDSISFSGYYGGPANGTISNINGLCFTYTPNQDFNGLDSLYIIVCDDGIPSLCDTAIVYINVTPVNDPPVIVDSNVIATDTLYYTTPEDTPITICIDAIDIDGDSISFSGYYGGPANGTISNINGLCFTYTPNQDFNGLDSLYIIVCDDGIPSLCDTAIVYINVIPVNDPPVIVDPNGNPTDTVYVTTLEDHPVLICLNAIDVDGDSVSVTGYFGGPTNGTVTGINVGDTCFTYIPNPNYYGQDTVHIIICDNNGGCDTVVVVITVEPVNDPPVIVDNNGNPTDVIIEYTNENTPITICLDVIDIENDITDVTGYFGGPFNGSISGVNDGDTCFTYTPNPNFTGIDSLYIIVCDNGLPQNECDTVLVIIHVLPVNNPPVIIDENGNPIDTIYVTTIVNTPITVCLDAFDLDMDSVIVSGYFGGPANGTITIIDSSLCFTYTPNPDYVGQDTVHIIVSDGNGGFDTVVVIITVLPVDVPPGEPHFGGSIPQGFSPNGDGVGDFWVIPGIEKYPNNTVTIYNRWGNTVYQAHPYQNDWNGKSNGAGTIGEWLPTGTYFYIIDLGDGSKPFNGYVYLKY